jgi:hypothetical protein
VGRGEASWARRGDGRRSAGGRGGGWAPLRGGRAGQG